MLSAAKATGSGFLVRYVQATIDASNLRSAVRTLRMKKGADLLKRVLVEGGTIRTDSVQAAALGGSLEELYRPTSLRQAAELGKGAAGRGYRRLIPVDVRPDGLRQLLGDINDGVLLLGELML